MYFEMIGTTILYYRAECNNVPCYSYSFITVLNNFGAQKCEDILSSLYTNILLHHAKNLDKTLEIIWYYPLNRD